MITDIGKQILAKFIAGQVEQPLAYIALGAGGTPVDLAGADVNDPEPIEYASKTSLNFESVRIPVSGSAVVNEGVSGQNTYVVLSGTVPTAQRFEFSEIGIFPDITDSLLTSTRDQNLLSFSPAEPWQESVGGLLKDIPYVNSISIDNVSIYAEDDDGNQVTAFTADANNDILSNSSRIHGTTRVFSESLMLRADTEKVVLPSALIDLSRANASDSIKLALCVMPTANPDASPGIMTKINSVTVTIEFAETAASPTKATWVQTINNSAPTLFSDSGHAVISGLFGDITDVGNVEWDKISYVGVSVSASLSGSTEADWYIALDSLRFDSSNRKNSTYGLMAYSLVQNDGGLCVVKGTGQQSEIEYKVSVGVDRDVT